MGRELALQLCQLGVAVACVDINAESCEATVQQALQLHGTCKRYQCDVRDKDAVHIHICFYSYFYGITILSWFQIIVVKQVAHTTELIKDHLGEITMLFHCCGLPSPRALTQEPPEIRVTMDLCVISHFWVSISFRCMIAIYKIRRSAYEIDIFSQVLDAVLPRMQRAGKGHITILSSVAGLSTGARGGTRIPLSTAQFAVQGLAESLLMELRHSNKNIIVTLVHVYPFIIGTEVAKDIRFRYNIFRIACCANSRKFINIYSAYRTYN